MKTTLDLLRTPVAGGLWLALLAGFFLAAPAAADNEEIAVNAETVQAAIDAGLDFLLKDQRKNGAWGGPQRAVYTFTGSVWSNPETHRAWRVATTGLCCMALIEVGRTDEQMAALDRGLAYLCNNADVKRPNEWDTMNNWAYIYGGRALAEALMFPRYADHPMREQIKAAAEANLKLLGHFQSVHGGWGYLEFDVPRTQRPQWGTSFMTASGIITIETARKAGLEIDQGVLDRAVRIVDHCRLPNGAYTYHVREIPNLHSEYIDQVKGSLSRIQVCQEALKEAGRDITLDQFRDGLNKFFRDHRFLDIARNKPIPHENFYYNSGYFYLYGHYYAAMVIERLPAEERAKYWPQLQFEIMKMQQKDGSIWDYDMHDYHKPYGVAYGLMALGRSQRERM